MQKTLQLQEMIQDLLPISEEAWGFYVFSRDILNQRITPDEKKQMIKYSIHCGKKYAKRIIEECGSKDAKQIAEYLNINVSLEDTSMIGKRVLFASYTPPQEITIMKEPINQAIKQIEKEEAVVVELFKQDGIMNTILGHEIFHFIEERFEQEIYTRTKKILLWNFMGFKNYSTIRALGEIGAMAFTKEINELNFSPFILDILLYYGYDSLGAEKIYRDILEISSGRCRETVEGGYQ